MKPKVYMVCDYTDEKAASISGCPDVGVEYLGSCGGRILHENGAEIGVRIRTVYRYQNQARKNGLITTNNGVANEKA